jgi:hypothetical protein
MFAPGSGGGIVTAQLSALIVAKPASLLQHATLADGRDGSFTSFSAHPLNVGYSPESDKKSGHAECPRCADTVAKVVLNWGSKFLRAVGAVFE